MNPVTKFGAVPQPDDQRIMMMVDMFMKKIFGEKRNYLIIDLREGKNLLELSESPAGNVGGPAIAKGIDKNHQLP